MIFKKHNNIGSSFWKEKKVLVLWRSQEEAKPREAVRLQSHPNTT